MRQYFYLLLTAMLLSSCGVKYKTVPYFTDLPIDSAVQEQITNQTVLKIQKNDILAITVSSLDPQSDAYFNLGNIGASQQGSGTTSTGNNGFIVDAQGNVQLPYLGAVKVEGLSTYAARQMIEKKLESGKILVKPVVNIRLANFKISVLGDVARPGVFPVQSERITIIEALGMAGDLTITAKRNDILLIRENLGKRQQVRLDLQSKELFNSPYYYLENNDVLVVTPSSAKYASVDSSYRNVSMILSALSILAILITRL